MSRPPDSLESGAMPSPIRETLWQRRAELAPLVYDEVHIKMGRPVELAEGLFLLFKSVRLFLFYSLQFLCWIFHEGNLGQ